MDGSGGSAGRWPEVRSKVLRPIGLVCVAVTRIEGFRRAPLMMLRAMLKDALDGRTAKKRSLPL